MPARPASRRTIGRRSRFTAASCSPRIATRRGRPAGATRCARRTWGCCSSSPPACAEGGDTAAAIEALEQAVVVDPLHEAAHRALMRMFAADGRRQQALAQYHQLREALRRELEAEPDPQTARLYRALLRGEVDVGPAEPELREQATRAPRARAGRARSPQPAGRADELHRARARAARGRPAARPPSPGHAHRRRRVGQDPSRPRGRDGARRAQCRDGVWLVELAGLSDPRWWRPRPPPRSGSPSRPSARPSRASAPSSASGARC